MTLPRAPHHGPIFVVGANGSGSTLLRLMLDSHDRIAIPEETGFLRLALAHTQVPYWELGDQWHRHLGLDDDGLYRSLQEFYGGLFTKYAEAHGKARWGDKTPFHVWHLDLARRIFPDCVVVGIVRHPGAVVSSLQQRFGRGPEQALRHWRRSVTELLHAAADAGDRCVVLRYEDLVTDPKPVMAALLEWLGEPWSDAVLAHHQVQPAAGAPRTVEGFTRTDRAIDPAEADRWERSLSPRDREALLGPVAGLAALLGYDIARTRPLGEFGVGEIPLLPGSAIAELRRQRAGGVDWAKRPQPTPENAPLRPPPPRLGGSAPSRPITPAPLRTAVGRRLPTPVRRWVNQRRAGRSR
ncbi:MAG TPA: sulfotransferase [Mycobacteriales bacterium]|nr:sulfotransferase [Mycobacteriales bacterium]